MQAGRGRIKTDVSGHLLFGEHFAQIGRGFVQHAAPVKFVIEVHRVFGIITNSAKSGLRRRAESSIEAAMNRREFSAGLLVATGSVGLAPLIRASGAAPLRINGARLNEHLKALSEFGKNPQGGVSRVAYSEADRQGREYVIGLMRDAKLDTSIDAAGNLIGRRAG